MSDSIRTFIAVKIIPGQSLRNTINLLKTELSGELVKWFDIRDLHLTLKFLGDVDTKLLENIKKKMEIVSQNFPVFNLQLTGLGYFENNRQPSILFAKIEENKFFLELYKQLETQLLEIGFEKEKRSFKPHLTLARIKHLKIRNHFYTLLKNYDKNEFQESRIEEIILYQSTLTSSGPIYKPLKIVKLG
jgi:2'-5' RNA ligase